jgi:hypothetical protein
MFNLPVFAPGWAVGFDCVVALGQQGRGATCHRWRRGDADHPNKWGDLVLLGTDARVLVQNADRNGSISRMAIPGHSYLITIIDPDRNIDLAFKDSVVVSAETAGSGQAGDAEVFVLRETGPNTGIFRGYVDTQPGFGGDVLGVLEISAGQKLLFRYVDFGDAEGRRGVVKTAQLPVVAGIMGASAK